MQHTSRRSLRRLRRDAQLGRDLVCRTEPDAADVLGEAVGVFAQHRPSPHAELAVDARGMVGGHAMLLQKQHDPPQLTLLVPRLGQRRCALGADAGYLS